MSAQDEMPAVTLAAQAGTEVCTPRLARIDSRLFLIARRVDCVEPDEVRRQVDDFGAIDLCSGVTLRAVPSFQ